MRAKILIKSFFFIFVFCYFVMPNFVEANTLQNSCEYTYVSTARDGSSKTSRIMVNMYGSGTNITRMNATIYSLYDDDGYEESSRYKIDNWNQNYDFYFNFSTDDALYNLETDDIFRNVDTVTVRGTGASSRAYIGRTVSFPAYVTDANNFDFSKCPRYLYVANIWQGAGSDPDINIFISDNNHDANGNLYKDLLTIFTLKLEDHGLATEDTFDEDAAAIEQRNQGCPYDGAIWWTSPSQRLTANYKFCITNPHSNGSSGNVSYFSDDGTETTYNYVAVAANDPVNHYDEVQANQSNTTGFGEKIGCENLFTKEEGSVGWILQRILNYIKIFGPIAVILLSAIDFIKAIMSSDEKVMQSVQSKFIIRLIAAIALFLIPFIVELILNIFLGINNPTCGLR